MTNDHQLTNFMKNSISIIGAGSWGTTLAVYLAKKGILVKLHSAFKQHNLAMARDRENKSFLEGVRFPEPLLIDSSLKNSLESEIILFAIPVKFIRRVLRAISNSRVDLRGRVLVSASKGIESRSLKRVSEVIKEVLKVERVAVLSGPNIAKEVAKGMPSASILASQSKRTGKRLQKLFNSQTFRIYLHEDVTGVELGGSLKNIIALSCGISDGLGFGTNTKAALVTRGLAEITRMGKKLGANPATLWGISGLGDLMTTCFSPYSRNRKVGELIGKGEKLKSVVSQMDMVAEGVETVKSAYKLSKKMEVDMPITLQVYSVLYRNKSPRKAVADLMNRPLKEEENS